MYIQFKTPFLHSWSKKVHKITKLWYIRYKISTPLDCYTQTQRQAVRNYIFVFNFSQDEVVVFFQVYDYLSLTATQMACIHNRAWEAMNHNNQN